MDLPLTLQTLKLDCLLEILKYVPLPVCMSLRSSCRQLKTAVDEHFRTGVKALPVMLSSHYSPEFTAKFDRICQEPIIGYNMRVYMAFKMSVSSGVSQREFHDKPDVFLVREKHFLPVNYLILFKPAKFDEFVAFITKYLPNVTKLSLLIDHNEYLNNIPSILNLYQKQLRVLKLEKTLRSGIMFNDNIDEEIYRIKEQSFELPNELYDSLNNLEVLKALYFFTKTRGNLHLGDTQVNEHGRIVVDPASPGHQCIDRLVHRLKVLHIMCDKFLFFRLKPEPYESLEELACWCSGILQGTQASFPRLERLFFATKYNSFEKLSKVMPNLRYISTHDLYVTPWGIADLNCIPNLERICCGNVVSYRWEEEYDSDDDEQVPGFNRTVQYIEVNLYGDQLDAQELDELKHSMSFFTNLKKVIFREPYMELTAADLQAAN